MRQGYIRLLNPISNFHLNYLILIHQIMNYF